MKVNEIKLQKSESITMNIFSRRKLIFSEMRSYLTREDSLSIQGLEGGLKIFKDLASGS